MTRNPLDSEDAFAGEYPVLPNPTPEEWGAIINYFENRWAEEPCGCGPDACELHKNVRRAVMARRDATALPRRIDSAEPEPPHASVVLDSDGHAWQRLTTDSGDKWFSIFGFDPHPWSELSDGFGPLLLVCIEGWNTP